jgi:CBS domain containing-hemolysin-like protein
MSSCNTVYEWLLFNAAVVISQLCHREKMLLLMVRRWYLFVLDNKGNNKITEHRAIFQRERLRRIFRGTHTGISLATLGFGLCGITFYSGFGLYRITFNSGFGLYRITFYSGFGLYRITFYSGFGLRHASLYFYITTNPNNPVVILRFATLVG